MIPHARFAPESAESNGLMTEFRSDPLYVKLCRMHSSVDARATADTQAVALRFMP